MALRVGVIADWERSARGNVWPEILADIRRDHRIDTVLTIYPLANLIVEPPDAGGLQTIREQDVLVINWDAANGDPDFGSHLALRWLEHRRAELLMWVSDGGILVIESQATLGVASQPAYDAVVGPGELPVSGPEDATLPVAIRERLGATCRRTNRFPKLKGFQNVPEPLFVATPVDHKAWFPGPSTTLLSEHIRDLDEGRQLYRGWFRRTLPGRRALPWVTLLVTADRAARRPARREHSTMDVAKVGEGAIFATTIALSMTRQLRLIVAILNCVGENNTQHLPSPESFIERVRLYWNKLLTVVSGTAAGLIAGLSGDWVHSVASFFGEASAVGDPATLKGWIKAGFVPAGVALFAFGHWLFVRVRRAIDDYVGY